jgi:hypothetical protein
MAEAMTFNDAVEALDSLCGERMEATIWGPMKKGPSIASLTGEFERVAPSDDLPAGFERVIAVTATVFRFGRQPENALNLWPDRFLRASRLATGEGIEVETMDAVIRIAKRRPWID